MNAQYETMYVSHPIRRVLLALFLSIFAQIASAQSIRPGTDRLDAIVSYPLVISIVAENERDLRSDVTSTLDDGRAMNSTPYWVGISPQRSAPGWTLAQGLWTATGYRSIIKIPKSERPLGSWFIRVPLPVDAVGQGLWIDGTRYELNWLPDPERALLESHAQRNPNDLEAFWSKHLPDESLSDPAIHRAIDQFLHNPFQVWRAHLLVEGLDPGRGHTGDGAFNTEKSLQSLDLELSLQTPGADLLRDLAHQQEARWQIILGRIWLIDPEIADRLKAQFMRTARFGERTLPVWTSDAAEIAELAHDLLSPFVDDPTRTLRAKAWLESQPRALAWISDDQGQIEVGSGRFIPTLTVLSLPQTPGASLLRVDAPSLVDSSSPVLTTVSPNLATPTSLPIDPIALSPSSPVLETTPIRVRTGRWSAERRVIASPTPARAPYVRIGPLLNDWNMVALVNNRPLEGASARPTRAAQGILYKSSLPSRDNPNLGWTLYFEANSPDPTSPNESLRLWIGPYTHPFAVWKLSPSGQVVFEIGSRPNIAIPKVQTRILRGRWVAMIDLPPGVFDSDHLLQLGLERTDANNIHTAWPRRMIPDQQEPGRLTIEGDRFDQLRAN